MNKTRGRIILIIFLVLPILWVFLWRSTEYGYKKLPIYSDIVFGDTIPFTIDEFSFYDQEGNVFTRDSLKNRIYVANFFFTTCPDVCPQMNNNVKYLTQHFKDNDGLIFLSHTVNPSNDSVEVLNGYAKKVDATYGQWYFLTGNKLEIYQLAMNNYKAAAVEELTENTFIHSEKLALVDRDYRIRGFYEGRDFQDIQKLKDDIKILFKEYKDQK
jgi:protein SCO1/2